MLLLGDPAVLILAQTYTQIKVLEIYCTFVCVCVCTLWEEDDHLGTLSRIIMASQDHFIMLDQSK